MGFSRYGTMLSGIRKFCDNHLIGQFLFEGVVDMFADGLVITAEPMSLTVRVSATACRRPSLLLSLDGVTLVFVYENLVLHMFNNVSSV